MNQQIIRIGSSPKSDIVVEGGNAAETHALLYFEGEMICLEILPGNSVVLNGNDVEGKYWVNENDDIIVGSTRLAWAEINFLLGLGRNASSSRFRRTPLDASAAIGDVPMAVPIRRSLWWIPVTICALGVLCFLGYRVYELQRETNQCKMELQKIDSMKMDNDRQTDSIFEMYK